MTQGADAIFKSISDAGIRSGPGDRLLEPTMRGAFDLLRHVVEDDAKSQDSGIIPAAAFSAMVNDASAPLTVRAAAAILVGLHREVQLLVAVLELKAGDFQCLQAQQFAQQFRVGHRSPFVRGSWQPRDEVRVIFKQAHALPSFRRTPRRIDPTPSPAPGRGSPCRRTGSGYRQGRLACPQPLSVLGKKHGSRVRLAGLRPPWTHASSPRTVTPFAHSEPCENPLADPD